MELLATNKSAVHITCVYFS